MIHLPETALSTTVANVAALRQALRRLRRQTRRWVWIESVGFVALLVAVVFWATLFIDRFLEPPWQVRVAMLAAAGGIVGWLIATKLVGRLAAPLDDAQLALVVERNYPQFQDSLSTVVELSRGPRENVNESLLARTAAIAASRLEAVDPSVIFRRRSLAALAVTSILALSA
jgi:hypothetical protein